MPFLLRNAVQAYNERLDDVEAARRRMDDLVQDCLNARSQINSAINSLEHAAPNDPFSLLGDKVFRPGNGDRRQEAINRFRQCQNMAVEYQASLGRVQQKLTTMLNILRFNVRFLQLAQGNLRLISTMHILSNGLGVDLNFGGIRLGAWLVTGIASLAFTVSLGMALSTAVASVTLAAPAIVAALAVVAFIVGGIVAGEVRMQKFEECRNKANAAHTQLQAAQDHLRQAEETIDSQFAAVRESLRRLGSTAQTPNEIEAKMHDLYCNTRELQSTLRRHRRQVARGDPRAMEDALEDLSDLSINFSADEKRQLLEVDLVFESAGDEGIADVSSRLRDMGVEVTDKVLAFARLVLADVSRDDCEEDDASTTAGDTDGWEEVNALLEDD